jgi:hydroxycarboxylate dehydrogenase B
VRNIQQAPLRRLVAAMFAKAGSAREEAETVARRLIDSNLAGHDSHGVVRVPAYVQWVKDGKVKINQHARIVNESDAFAIVDGQGGFGQVVGGEAMAIGVAKARKTGVALVALRHAHHLGRIGDWAEHCAAENCASIHFVNVVHAGAIVAPFGGMERRTSTNPFCCGMPMTGRAPLILDFATSKIAEGKVQVARNKGVEVPENALIGPTGEDTRDPNALYGPPVGALLPMGEHKGYGLAFFCDILAGALSGGGCNHDGHPVTGTVHNNMLSIIIDMARLGDANAMNGEVEHFVRWMKSSRPRQAGGEVLAPGDPELRNRETRGRDGIPLDDTTIANMADTARDLGVDAATISAVTGVN